MVLNVLILNQANGNEEANRWQKAGIALAEKVRPVGKLMAGGQPHLCDNDPMSLSLNLNLSRKAMILVAVPLAFEIVFVVTLATLLASTEYERARENHAREITAHINGALTALLDRFSSCILRHVSDDVAFKNRFEVSLRKMHSELEALTYLTRDDPVEAQRMSEISKLLLSCTGSIQQAQASLDAGDRLSAGKQWMHADRNVGRFLAMVDLAVAQQQKLLEERQDAQKRYGHVVQLVLIVGIAFNVVLALGLAAYFNRGTIKRLNVLLDNTRRLAEDEPLNAPLTGTDEIAILDETFREMAESLDEARRKERAVVRNAVDVICSIARDADFVAINPAAEKLWGYSVKELVGKSLKSIVHEEDWAATVKAVEGIILSKEQRGNFENRVRCKDRGVVDFAWSAHWSAQDQTLFCVARDISERKMIDRLKRDFVAMVSHDLRTPLTSIQMLLSLLEAEAYGPLNENGRENVAAAEASVERLIGLVNGLLDLEKMESGKLDLLRESWHVGDVLEPSLQAVRGFAFQQGVSVVVPVHADIEIFADRDRLVQVLINLISNAIKFSPRGGTVDLTVAEEPRWVTFGVKDQGRGVPPEMREAIFDRFKQVEHDDARVKGGSGLGLAICKAIVERHGGLIGVDSVEGKGSNFWFKLPRQPGAL